MKSTHTPLYDKLGGGRVNQIIIQIFLVKKHLSKLFAFRIEGLMYILW